ncbi:MAG: DNA recombination protein RmuC [Oscillospiraceae bacterium]|jgi:DNA recombination protein RmuC|nr:DNA recombination protein RmuC [Oscillospiraceae bacterium]
MVEYVILGVSALVVILQLILLFRRPKKEDTEKSLTDVVRENTRDIVTQTSQDGRALREEVGGQIDRLRDSLTVLLNGAKDAQQTAISSLSDNTADALEKIRANVDDKLSRSTESQSTKFNEFKDSFNVKLDEFKDSLSVKLDELKLAHTETFNLFTISTSGSLEKIRENMDTKLGELIEAQNRRLLLLSESNTQGMESVRNKVDERLNLMQLSNEKRLDEMRQTVDEKLEKTLETRLQKSFETVSVQLESVNKGLGEMKTVAESVGSLNKVLNNTKTRGILGELQLGQIIEDMLPPNLYDKEVSTIKGSVERVEYAVKLPGSGDGGHVYLPIDSKFPLEDYYRLVEGYDTNNVEQVEISRKALLARIKQFAKDVKLKYVSPPDTTNFAVVFFPTEGLYSEVVRDAAFFDGLRQDGIIVAGPTTLSAMLSSLQVGFKTLQIQKSASDIEKMLGAVKKEFETFETILTKAHTRITQAGSDIEKLVGTRARAINRTLRDVQTYSGEDAPALLGIAVETGLEDDSEIQLELSDE